MSVTSLATSSFHNIALSSESVFVISVTTKQPYAPLMNSFDRD